MWTRRRSRPPRTRWRSSHRVDGMTTSHLRLFPGAGRMPAASAPPHRSTARQKGTRQWHHGLTRALARPSTRTAQGASAPCSQDIRHANKKRRGKHSAYLSVFGRGRRTWSPLRSGRLVTCVPLARTRPSARGFGVDVGKRTGGMGEGQCCPVPAATKSAGSFLIFWKQQIFCVNSTTICFLLFQRFRLWPKA